MKLALQNVYVSECNTGKSKLGNSYSTCKIWSPELGEVKVFCKEVGKFPPEGMNKDLSLDVKAENGDLRAKF